MSLTSLTKKETVNARSIAVLLMKLSKNQRYFAVVLICCSMSFVKGHKPVFMVNNFKKADIRGAEDETQTEGGKIWIFC